MKESNTSSAAARRELTPFASPRFEEWLQRKSEGVAPTEREKAAALADREQADALRAKLAATRSRLRRDAEERRADRRERAAPVRESATREFRRRSSGRQQEVRRRSNEPQRAARRSFNEPQREARRRFNESRWAYSYASEPGWRSYPDRV